MQPRVSLVTLGTRDFPRALRFYRDGLGWPLSRASTEDTAFFRTGGAVLTLWSRASLAADAHLPVEGSGFGGIVLACNVNSRAEVDELLERVVAAGGTLLAAGREAVWGGYIGHFADPEGHPWEVAWNPYFPLVEDGRMLLPDDVEEAADELP